MSESTTNSTATVESWFEYVDTVADVVAGTLLAAFFIWLVVRIVNDRAKLKTKGLAFWMAAGMLAVGALSLAALSAIMWLLNFK
jgi:high-affinity Fe2+/Pb2+ permease